MAVDVVKVFPFLLLHPRTRVTAERESHALQSWLKRLLLYIALNRDGSINMPALYFLLLVLALTASSLIVYFMLALTQGFPHMGKHYRTICIVKDFMTILLLRSLSSSYMMRNPAGEVQHYVELDQFQPGIFSMVRQLAYGWILRAEPPQHRWYSSYIGDHILLFMVGSVYIFAFAMLPVLYWSAWPTSSCFACYFWCIWNNVSVLYQAVQGIYVAVLLMGFLYCALEHSARFRPGAQRGARAHLLCFIVLWVPQFLIWYRVHDDIEKSQAEVLEEIFDMLGAAPQIFISHSSAMVGAIILGHHERYHRCQDLPWRASWYLGACVLGYFAFTEAFLRLTAKGRFHPDSMKAAFALAAAGPYMRVAWHSTVSFVCICWVRKHGKAPTRTSARTWGLGHFPDAAQARRSGEYAADPLRIRSSSLPDVVRQSTAPLDAHEEAAWQHLRTVTIRPSIDTEHHSDHGRAHEGSGFFDYDCALITLTLVVGSLGYFVKIYAHYSVGELHSYVKEVISGVVFPVSIAYFVIVAWALNPKKSIMLKVGLWLGLLAAACAVSNRSAIEHCLVRVAQNPAYGPSPCCFFPGLPDFNARELEIEDYGVMTVAQACNKDVFGVPSHHGSEGEGGGHEKAPDGILFAEGSPEDGHRHDHGRGSGGPAGGGEDGKVLRLAEELSTAFFFFETFGSVGQVEFFFTLIGLFLKLILRLPSSGAGMATSHRSVDHRNPSGTFEWGHMPSGTELATVRESPSSSLAEEAEDG